MFRSCHLDYLADGRGKFKISDQSDVPEAVALYRKIGYNTIVSIHDEKGILT